MSLYSITSGCGIKVSPADSVAIATHLRTYFNGNQANFFRLLFKQELGVNSNLVAIQTLLNPYNCSLTQVAVDNPVACAQEPEKPAMSLPKSSGLFQSNPCIFIRLSAYA